ncbi:MAG: hypothetical protein KDI22_14640 [Gammaproteobacteria bacterium]|nr:hypothetical protein [Gammaproteobacteria bacterium]
MNGMALLAATPMPTLRHTAIYLFYRIKSIRHPTNRHKSIGGNPPIGLRPLCDVSPMQQGWRPGCQGDRNLPDAMEKIDEIKVRVMHTGSAARAAPFHPTGTSPTHNGGNHRALARPQPDLCPMSGHL